MLIDGSPYRIRVHRGASVAANPTTSIIVLVTRDTTRLRGCLRAVHETESPDDASELIVVANGTPLWALADLEGREDIVLIQSLVNHGFAGGCNLAVRHARGRRLAFLNDDATVTDGWLAGLHRALDADPDVAVAGGKVLLADGRLQEAGSVLWRDGSISGVGRGDSPDAPKFTASRAVDYVSFCCALVRRTAWEDAGGFDERYFPAYYEDLDLCMALHRLGWKVMYEPACVIHHAEGGSGTPHFRDFLSRRNRMAFVSKWAAELQDYEDPPATAAEREGAEGRALLRAADRRVPVRPGASTLARQQQPAPDQAIDDTDALVLHIRHLSAALTIDDDYIRLLRQEAATLSFRDLIKAKLRPILMHAKRRLHWYGSAPPKRRRRQL